MVTAQVRRRAPGFCQLLPLPFGTMANPMREPLEFLLGGMKRYGDVFRYQMGPFRMLVVAHPDHVRHVVLDNQKNYLRGWLYNRSKSIIGAGLVTTDGAAWRRLRRIVQPAFARDRLAALGGTMTAAAAATGERWEQYADRGEPVDLADEFMGLTLQVAGKTLLGVDLERAIDEIGPAVTAFLEYSERRLAEIIPRPSSVFGPRAQRFRRARSTLDGILYAAIARRRAAPAGGDGETGELLSLLLTARDEETGEALSDLEVRDQIFTFLIAGHETTALALAWTFYLLSQHQDVAQRQADEVRQVLGGRTPEVTDLQRLAYTRQVIEEALRLYPPVYAVARDAQKPDEIGGYHIPARTMVVLSPYLTHHHPDIWPEPERFDPDRFTPERIAARPRFAWFPFLGGPHQCIGQEFAMMEATLVTAMLTQLFRFELAPGAQVVARPMLSLRPRDGMPMIIRRA